MTIFGITVTLGGSYLDLVQIAGELFAIRWCLTNYNIWNGNKKEKKAR